MTLCRVHQSVVLATLDTPSMLQLLKILLLSLRTKLILQREMSQEVLSGLAGVARSHLAMIESGSKNANVETLWRIVAALDMRMSELMRLVEDELDRMNHVTKP